MKRIDRKYQQLLKELKLYSGAIDGLQGNLTTEAVRRFQSMNGLVSDGIVGANTRRVMDSMIEPIAQNQAPPAAAASQQAGYRRWPQETDAELHRFYGSVGTRQTRLELPYAMRLAWDLDKTVKTISCHELVANSLHQVLTDVKAAYKPAEIVRHGFDLFGGCLNVRKIRGGNRWSTHSWGIAIDIDPARNGLRTSWKQAYLSRPECVAFVEAFRRQGWYSLGLEKNFDAMHFQACWR